MRMLTACAVLLLATPALADDRVVEAALARLEASVRYDPAYVRLDYPGGDVPSDTGVCTDVVIRAYREALDFDFQRAVHEDMRADFAAYPANWGLTRPDRNIDHRRVPNLETYLERRGAALPVTDDPDDYRPGDIVTWRLDGRLPHIGIVTHARSPAGVPLIVHNIGAGPVHDDILFRAPITAHFRFVPDPTPSPD